MQPEIETPENRNQRLQMTDLTKPGTTCRLTGTGPGLACQDPAGQVLGRFWNRTKPFFQSEPGPLAGYPDLLLTLLGGGDSASWKINLEFAINRVCTCT
jgi:hypothetical protein